MKTRRILMYLMAFILLLRPAVAMAAESGKESTAQEQAESAARQEEPAEEPVVEKETDGMTVEADDAEIEPETAQSLTDNLPQDGNSEAGQTDSNPSGGQGEEDSLPEDGKDLQEGAAEQETEETEGIQTEGIEAEGTQTEGTETEGTQTEGTEAEGTQTEGTKAERTETEKTETEETEEIETAETETGETAAAAENGAAEPEQEGSRIVLELPMLDHDDSSPFDFIMDPQGLITETNAVRYDCASFEEDATLYFKNTDGDYGYSHISDWLGIISHSNVPVCVTVELTVENTSEISLVQSPSFSGGECSMYLALLDSDGNETAVGADGKAVSRMMLPACGNESEASICSFALTGCCNPDGDWFGMAKCPCITVNWTVEPMISEEVSNEL